MAWDFEKSLLAHNIKPDMARFARYYDMLMDWNTRMNLTAITEKKDVYLKHFYDSLTAAFVFDFKDQTLLDVGAGAGFPSLPLKICFPDLKIVIAEPVQKKTRFLASLAQELELDITLTNQRAEDLAKDCRETFDIVTARAVAPFEILDELCLPLVKVNGTWIVYKGSRGDQEYEKARAGIALLGGELALRDEFFLDDEQKRINYYIKKVKPTPPEYPRAYARIKKQPLGA